MFLRLPVHLGKQCFARGTFHTKNPVKSGNFPDRGGRGLKIDNWSERSVCARATKWPLY